MSLTDLLASW